MNAGNQGDLLPLVIALYVDKVVMRLFRDQK